MVLVRTLELGRCHCIGTADSAAYSAELLLINIAIGN